MQRSLSLKAIDSAFIAHVGKLFETFCLDLQTEASAASEEARHSKLPSARARFERSFAFARTTHSQMTEHVEMLGDRL